jgi:hypothetical protein
MPADGFEVIDSELREFAKALQGTADKLAASAGNVRGVSYSPTTWGIMPVGLICLGIAKSGTDSAGGALDKAATGVRDASAGVENTADLYEDVDGFIAEHHFGSDK